MPDSSSAACASAGATAGIDRTGGATGTDLAVEGAIGALVAATGAVATGAAGRALFVFVAVGVATVGAIGRGAGGSLGATVAATAADAAATGAPPVRPYKVRNEAGIAVVIRLRSVVSKLATEAGVAEPPKRDRSAASTMGAASVVRPEAALGLTCVAVATAPIMRAIRSPNAKPSSLLPASCAPEAGKPPLSNPVMLANMPASGSRPLTRAATLVIVAASPDFWIRPPRMLVEAVPSVAVAAVSLSPSVDVADWIIAGVAMSWIASSIVAAMSVTPSR